MSDFPVDVQTEARREIIVGATKTAIGAFRLNPGVADLLLDTFVADTANVSENLQWGHAVIKFPMGETWDIVDIIVHVVNGAVAVATQAQRFQAGDVLLRNEFHLDVTGTQLDSIADFGSLFGYYAAKEFADVDL